MHSGTFIRIEEVLDHYNDIGRMNAYTNLDPTLSRGGRGELNMNNQEKHALITFIKSLSGKNIYSEEKWSNVFN